RACSAASPLALLHGQVLAIGHERVGGHGRRFQVGAPVARTRREDDLIALLANEHFGRRELVLLWQSDSLTAIGHEDLGGAGHGQKPPTPLCHIRHVYRSACAIRASTRAFQRIWRIWGSRIPVSSLFSTPDSGSNPTLSANLRHQHNKALAALNAPMGTFSKNLTDAAMRRRPNPLSVRAGVTRNSTTSPRARRHGSPRRDSVPRGRKSSTFTRDLRGEPVSL